MIPVEMPEGMTDPGDAEIEMVVPTTPDAVFNAPVRRDARPTRLGFIASREISSNMGLIDTQSMEMGSGAL
jgi:hypothetical protein